MPFVGLCFYVSHFGPFRLEGRCRIVKTYGPTLLAVQQLFGGGTWQCAVQPGQVPPQRESSYSHTPVRSILTGGRTLSFARHLCKALLSLTVAAGPRSKSTSKGSVLLTGCDIVGEKRLTWHGKAPCQAQRSCLSQGSTCISSQPSTSGMVTRGAGRGWQAGGQEALNRAGSGRNKAAAGINSPMRFKP